MWFQELPKPNTTPKGLKTKSKYRGVYLVGTKWCAKLCFEKKRLHLGHLGTNQQKKNQKKINEIILWGFFVVFVSFCLKFESEMSAALAFDQKCLELGLNDWLNSVRFPEDFAPFQQQTKKFLTKPILENQRTTKIYLCRWKWEFYEWIW